MSVNKHSHTLRAHISKSKRCFNMKSSTHYFHLKTKALADFQICISIPLSWMETLIFESFLSSFSALFVYPELALRSKYALLSLFTLL